MKKFKLSDLQLESFAVTLDDAKKDLIKGGYVIGGGGSAGPASGVGCKSNPKTDETKEVTCTLQPSDTTGGGSCK
jgi:hypothetical protein